MLHDNVRFNVSSDVITVNDRTFARGSLVILKGNNRPEVDAVLGRLASEIHIAVTPVDSGWSGATSFGSSSKLILREALELFRIASSPYETAVVHSTLGELFARSGRRNLS